MRELFRGGCLRAAEEGGRDWRARRIHSDVEPCWRLIVIGRGGKIVCNSPTSIVPMICRAAVWIILAGDEGRFVDGVVGRWIAF